MCYLLAGTAGVGIPKAALNAPNSTSLAGIGLEEKDGAGPCWDQSQEKPGWVWNWNRGQE